MNSFDSETTGTNLQKKKEEVGLFRRVFRFYIRTVTAVPLFVCEGMWKCFKLITLFPIYFVLLKPIFIFLSLVMRIYITKFENKRMIQRKVENRIFRVMQRLQYNRKKAYSLLLDLEGVLVSIKEEKKKKTDSKVEVKLLGQAPKAVYIRKRPNLQRFLQEVRFYSIENSNEFL